MKRGSSAEKIIGPTTRPVRLGQLASYDPRSRARGAAHVAFNSTFELPFGKDTVSAYRSTAAPPGPEGPSPGPSAAWKVGGFSGLAVGGALAAVATGFALTGSVHDGLPASASQRDVAERNEAIDRHNTVSAGLFVASGITLAAGALMLILAPNRAAPDHATTTGLTPTWRF